jgi:hypothetical protein
VATTPDAVIDQMIALIEDITPQVHAHLGFKAYRDEMDFREWAQANPAQCLRRFCVTFAGDTSQALVTSTQLERVEEAVEIIVAYPTDFRHGATQLRGLRRVISRDSKQIDAKVGPSASDATLKELATVFRIETTSRENAGPVHFGVVPLRIEYARSLA